MERFLRIAGISVLVLLAGCSSARSFSDVVGNLRVTGSVSEDSLSSRAGLDVQIYDASTGYPVDARSVEVRAGKTDAVRAQRKQLGTYSAEIPNRRNIDLMITTRDDRSLLIALHRQ